MRLLEYWADRTTRYASSHRLYAAIAAVTGVGFGIALGLSLGRGHLGAVLLIGMSSAPLMLLVRLLTAAEERRTLVVIVSLALGVRFCMATLLHFWAETTGRAALTSTVPMFYVVGDDASYAELAWGVIQWLQGQPDPRFVPESWHGEAYLLGTFPYLEMIIFWAFGPVMVNVQIVNAAIGATTIVLLYGLTRRLWGARPAVLAASAVAVFPSLALWSALALKDALVSLLIVTVLWLYGRFQERPRWLLFVVILLALVTIETIRRYVYVVLAAFFPVAVVLSVGLDRSRRIAMTAVASVLALLLISLGASPGQGTYLLPTGLSAFESIRLGMGESARTSFADPRPIVVREGDSFVVVDRAQPLEPTATPVSTSPLEPTATPVRTSPRIVTVFPGGRVILVSASPSATPAAEPTPPSAPSSPPTPRTPEPPKAVVVVYAGDIVVVAQTAQTPGPTSAIQPLELTSNITLRNSADLVATNTTPEALTITRTIGYLPKGLAYALFAPFPWAVERAVDLLTIPEMLFWYVALGALVWSLWRARQRPARLIPMVLFVGAMLVILMLVEGNYGTLYRHRGMVIPAALALASPGLLALADWLTRRLRGAVGRR